MAKPDPNIAAHLEWIGFVRPTGLVVSVPALDRAGAILDRRDVEGQRLLRECADERRFALREEPQSWLPDCRAFASSVLGWSFSPKGYTRLGLSSFGARPTFEANGTGGGVAGWSGLISARTAPNGLPGATVKPGTDDRAAVLR